MLLAFSTGTYADVLQWAVEKAVKKGPHLLLGNGFSIAYDPQIFSYTALFQEAERNGGISPVAKRFFEDKGTQDFELVLQKMTAARQALKILDFNQYEEQINDLDEEIRLLKNTLAEVLASLHPERPYHVEEDQFENTATFLKPYGHIYTTNYDLLLYWTLRQATTHLQGIHHRPDDDGFRSRDLDDEIKDYVVWDYLKPTGQTIYYLHGALHLYRRSDGLRKLTWRRTNRALIDQIRDQLDSDYYPLYVSEGTAAEKRKKIQSSDYLSRGVRSLASVGGSLMVYGLSFSENDEHFMEAIVRSNIKRLGVSIYGDPDSSQNRQTIDAVNHLKVERERWSPREDKQLEVAFYDASDVDIW